MKKPQKEKQDLQINDNLEVQEVLHEVNLDEDFLKGIPKGKQQQLIGVFKQTLKRHSGPIPSPETIAQYDQIIPNGADRIMTMAEKQQSHRIELEKLAVSSQLTQSKRGQILGFVVAIIIMFLGTYLILEGHNAAGISLISGTLIAMTALFVLGKFIGHKEIREKQEED